MQARARSGTPQVSQRRTQQRVASQGSRASPDATQEPNVPAPLHGKRPPRRLVVTRSRAALSASAHGGHQQGRQAEPSAAAAPKLAALPEHEPLQSHAAAAGAQRQQGMVRTRERRGSDDFQSLPVVVEQQRRPKAQSAPVQQQLAPTSSAVMAAQAAPQPPSAPTAAALEKTAMPLQLKNVSLKRRSTRSTVSRASGKNQQGPSAAACIRKRPPTAKPGSLYAPLTLQLRILPPGSADLASLSNADSLLPPARLPLAPLQHFDKVTPEVISCELLHHSRLNPTFTSRVMNLIIFVSYIIRTTRRILWAAHWQLISDSMN